MDLRIAGIRECGPLPVGAPDGRSVAAHGVGGEEEDVAVSAGREDDRIRNVGLNLARYQVPHHDPSRLPIHDHEVQHFCTREQARVPEAELPAERGIGPDQELLSGLAATVEGPGYLRSAEGSVCQQATVLAGKRYSLGDALVDDTSADLGEPVDVRFSRPEVATLEGVIEQPVNTVAIVLVVLRRVDPALRRDAVSPSGAVLEAEYVHLVAQFRQGRGGRPAGQAGTDHNDSELAFVRGTDEVLLIPALGPLGGQGTGWGP